MINVHLLLGGMTGGFLDYPFNLGGMLSLADRLKKIPQVVVQTYTWGNWEKAARDTTYRSGVVIIGYSGGGTRATWLANSRHSPIDLMILYDPSPAWQMQPIFSNVKRAINYHNSKPGMWWPGVGALGGGVLTGHAVVMETVEVAENHLLVQFDQALHTRTIQEVTALNSIA